MRQFPSHRRLPALALGGAVLGLAAAACAIPASEAGTVTASASASAPAPVRCEVSITEARGATTIEGRVSAAHAVSGSYRLAILGRSAGGRSGITQSGDFSVSPDAPAMLGRTTLSGSRAQFTADLELRVNGEELRCSDGRI